MRRMVLYTVVAVVAAGLTGCETTDLGRTMSGMLASKGELSLDTVVAGLKEALRVGTANAVAQTSATGGFSKNKLLYIGTPEELSKVAGTMRKLGLGYMVDNFESRMNEAAEHASGEAVPVFVDAIKAMTFADARDILQGGETAATDYFREKTQDRLRVLYEPIVSTHLEQVGAVRVYNDLMARYNAIPLAPSPKFDLQSYVTQKALDGLFSVVANEEAKIRSDPVARTTELLQKVFARQ